MKEGDVALVEDPEEFVPADPLQPLVVVAAGFVEVDSKHSAFAAGRNLCRMALVLLDPLADRFVIGGRFGARHVALPASDGYVTEMIGGQRGSGISRAYK